MSFLIVANACVRLVRGTSINFYTTLVFCITLIIIFVENKTNEKLHNDYRSCIIND